MLRLNSTADCLKVEVALEFGALKRVMQWCRDNCRGEWSLDHTGSLDTDQLRLNTYEFVFNDEVDLVAFTVAWR